VEGGERGGQDVKECSGSVDGGADDKTTRRRHLSLLLTTLRCGHGGVSKVKGAQALQRTRFSVASRRLPWVGRKGFKPHASKPSMETQSQSAGKWATGGPIAA
jgi:hypothetical protein